MYQASAHYVQGKELDEAEAASRSTIVFSFIFKKNGT